MTETFTTRNEEETMRLGEHLANRLQPGDVVALYGDLGSGKTRLVKGISRGLGVSEAVTSPTFVVVNEHPGGRMPLFHFDFYRIRTIAELDEIGFDEYLDRSGICVVEWADLVRQRLPEHRYDIQCALGADDNERTFTIEKV